MTPEEMRVEIAQLVGWRQTKHPLGHDIFVENKGHYEIENDLPDFLNEPRAALSLVAHAKAEGWRCELNMGLNGDWECIFHREPNGATPLENIGVVNNEVREEWYHAGSNPDPVKAFCQSISGAFLKIYGHES